MKSIIPYTKSISFGTKIAEITSMSLEHEMDVKPGEISGNFIISGEYKSHEVSVNREPFLYKLPFSIELTENIDLDSIEFEITDFSYDILNDDTIEVSIEFSLDAIEMTSDEIEEAKEEERSIFEKVEDPVAISDITELMEASKDDEVTEIPEVEENVETDLSLDETKEKLEDVREEIVVEHEVKEDMKESEDTIIQNVNPMDDSYATYHIHIVKEGETVETICTMYQSNMNLLSEYNNMSEMNIGDKIIIPKEDE